MKHREGVNNSVEVGTSTIPSIHNCPGKEVERDTSLMLQNYLG